VAKEKKYRYSEIFSSIQGEGNYCGVPTAWLRLWGCNLECKGFGQDNVDDPTTWVLPYENFNPKDVIAMEDLPVWDYGCDSSYTWAKQYRHLAHLDPVSTIVDNIEGVLRSPHNVNSKFLHDKSKQETHFAITGGEPMMSQAAMVAILTELKARDNAPRFVTVETNGTQEVKDVFEDFMRLFYMTSDFDGYIDDERGVPEWFWSVSPKLRASGEKWNDAIKPEIVASYADLSDRGQLKFVVDGDNRTWYEVDKAVAEFREAECYWPVFIMPVGATKESQESEQTARIATEAIARGFNVSGRLHCYLWGNRVGT